MTVLYIDDDKDVVELMKMILSKSFDEVYYCYDGQEGLSLFKKYSPDLIISDILMPIKNGLEMSKEILKIDSKQKIILITANNESEFYETSKAIGVSGFLLKPIDIADLKRVIENVL